MLKDKYPLKSETHIQSLLETVQNGRIEESMWTKIIEKMYEDQDAQVLQENIRAIIQMRANGQNYSSTTLAKGAPKADATQTARKLTREELTKETVTVNKISQQLLYSDF